MLDARGRLQKVLSNDASLAVSAYQPLTSDLLSDEVFVDVADNDTVLDFLSLDDFAGTSECTILGRFDLLSKSSLCTRYGVSLL